MSAETEAMIMSMLRGLEEKVDKLQEQRYQNGKDFTALEGRIVTVESFVGDHKKIHEDESKYRRAINTKMWFLIIGGAIGVIFAILKDFIF